MGSWLPGVIHVLLAAHTTLASVGGTVRDGESGAPLPGAAVSLVDLDRTVFTDSLGRYLLPDVPPGPQHVAVSRLGYAARAFHALVPRQGALEIDVALRREPIALPVVEVRTAVAVRGLDGGGPAFPDRGLSLAAVRNHPLLSEPDFLEAARGGEVVLRPESPGGVHVRGGASDQVAYLLDGIPVLNPYHAAGTFSAWNPDALSRLDLVSSTPAPDLPDALSGAVSGTTRAPGPRLQTQGSLSSSQSRLTLDGPLGTAGAGYLMSVRTAFPGLLASKREGSHLKGESGDWLGKVETPLLGGRVSLLGFGSVTEVDVAARQPDAAPTGFERTRNGLEWQSTSLGGGWTFPLRGAWVSLRAWSAAGDAGATWKGPDSLPPERLRAERRDEGIVAMVETAGQRATTAAGVRVNRSRTFYQLRPDSGDGGALELSARTPVSAVFVRHRRPIASRGELEVSVAGALAEGAVRLDPGARFQWKPSDALTVSCGCSRRHQYAQSLRNAESVVSNIFPADLYVGADGGRVPVAVSDLGVVAVEHRPAPGLRLGAQAYARSFGSLLLVPPPDSGPFAATAFARGSGDAYGFTLQVGANGARYGVVADYGFQHVRLGYAGSSYVPDHGATHSIDAGIIVFPTPTSSARLGITSVLGRRTTAFRGPFEWEACNLLDRGCEFAGTPYGFEGLGETRLPAYHRVDLGFRKHWHLDLWGRDVQVAAFGAATNLLGRKNVLTVAVDPSTGERRRVEMRPLSPLVLGIDWRF